MEMVWVLTTLVSRVRQVSAMASASDSIDGASVACAAAWSSDATSSSPNARLSCPITWRSDWPLRWAIRSESAVLLAVGETVILLTLSLHCY